MMHGIMNLKLPEQYRVLLQWLMLHNTLEMQFNKAHHTCAVIWHVSVSLSLV